MEATEEKMRKKSEKVKAETEKKEIKSNVSRVYRIYL